MLKISYVSSPTVRSVRAPKVSGCESGLMHPFCRGPAGSAYRAVSRLPTRRRDPHSARADLDTLVERPIRNDFVTAPALLSPAQRAESSSCANGAVGAPAESCG